MLIFSVCFVSCSSVIGTGEESVSTYLITANLDSESMLTGKEEISYVHKGENTLSYIAMHLYANAYQKDGGEIRIDSAMIEGKYTPFSLKGENGEILILPLKEELFPGDEVKISLEYSLSIPQKEGRFGASGDTVRLTGWYPQLCPMIRGEWVESEVYGVGDHYFSDVADYEVRLTLAEDMVVASSGKRVSSVSSENSATHTFKGDKIRDFAFAISPQYHTVSAVYGSTLISVYAFSEEEAETVLPYAQNSFALYSEKYGRYPHSTYAVAVCETESGGMEYDGLVYVSRDLKGRDLEYVVAHETAHEWWYGAVGSDPTRYAWLDEGLAEYSTSEYIERYYGIEERQRRVFEKEQAYSSFCGALKSIKGRGDIPMTMRVCDYASNYEYVTVTYVKGELFFETLASVMGRKKFDEGLKRYYSSYSKKIATPDGLCDCLQEVTRSSLYPIFDAWESGKVYFGS